MFLLFLIELNSRHIAFKRIYRDSCLNLSISSRPNRINGESFIYSYPTLLLVTTLLETFFFSFIRYC